VRLIRVRLVLVNLNPKKKINDTYIHLHAKIRNAVRFQPAENFDLTTVMSDLAGATSFAALPPPRAALCSHFRIHGTFNGMLLYVTTASQQWWSAATWPSSALHRRHSFVRAITWIHRRPCPDQVSRGACSDFVLAARKVRCPDVHKRQQPAARCTHLLPTCLFRRPAWESGMKRAREQRGSGRPLYGIQQHVAALKTARTRRKHAYTPTLVRSNIF